MDILCCFLIRSALARESTGNKISESTIIIIEDTITSVISVPEDAMPTAKNITLPMSAAGIAAQIDKPARMSIDEKTKVAIVIANKGHTMQSAINQSKDFLAGSLSFG